MDFYHSYLLGALYSFDTPIVVDFFLFFYKPPTFETKGKVWCSLKLEACHVVEKPKLHFFLTHL